MADARRYRIVLRGECSDMLAAVPSDLTIVTHRGWTYVLVEVRDLSEFYGLLGQLQEFALDIVSLKELGADVLTE